MRSNSTLLPRAAPIGRLMPKGLGPMTTRPLPAPLADWLSDTMLDALGEEAVSQLRWLSGRSHELSYDECKAIRDGCLGSGAELDTAVVVVRTAVVSAAAQAVAHAAHKVSPADHVVRFVADCLLDDEGRWNADLLPALMEFLERGDLHLPSMLKHHLQQSLGILSAMPDITNAFDAIGDASPPLHRDGEHLVRLTLRRMDPKTALLPRDVRLAVMISLLSLGRQSAVGSCWWTWSQIQSQMTTPTQHLQQMVADCRDMLERGTLPFAAVPFKAVLMCGKDWTKVPLEDEHAPLNMAFSTLPLYAGGVEGEQQSAEVQRLHFPSRAFDLDAGSANGELLHAVMDALGVPAEREVRARFLNDAIRHLPFADRSRKSRSGTVLEFAECIFELQKGRPDDEPRPASRKTALSLAADVYAAFHHAPILKCRELTLPASIGLTSVVGCWYRIRPALTAFLQSRSDEKGKAALAMWETLDDLAREQFVRRGRTLIDPQTEGLGHQRVWFLPSSGMQDDGRSTVVHGWQDLVAVLAECIKDAATVSRGHHPTGLDVEQLTKACLSGDFSKYLSVSSEENPQPVPWLYSIGRGPITLIDDPNHRRRIPVATKNVDLGAVHNAEDLVCRFVEKMREDQRNDVDVASSTDAFHMVGGSVSGARADEGQQASRKVASRNHAFCFLPNHPSLAGALASPDEPQAWLRKTLAFRDQCEGWRVSPEAGALVSQVADVVLAHCPRRQREIVRAWRNGLRELAAKQSMYRPADLLAPVRELLQSFKGGRGYRQMKAKVSGLLMRLLDGRIVTVLDTNHGRGTDPLLAGVGVDFLSGKLRFWEYNEYADPLAPQGRRRENTRIAPSWHGEAQWSVLGGRWGEPKS